MLHTIFRNLVLGGVLFGLVVVALTFSSTIRVEKVEFTACSNDTSVQCLTDLGVDLALGARSLPPYMREVGMLAQMGRIEDALALELRVVSEKDRPPENVEAAVNRRLASHRITAALRNDIDLDVAIARTPYVDPGILWISALDLLGRNPYGTVTRPRNTPDDQVIAVVSDMAERIAGMAKVEQSPPQTSYLMYAAELQTALGNHAEVIKLLEALPPTENPLVYPTEALIRLVGSQDFLRFYREAGGRSPKILLTAASAEIERGLATEYLKTAFTEFSSRKPWPDFHWMERTVERAVNLGLEKLALKLAYELADQAETAPSAFPVFPHIKAARALMAAGAGEDEIRDKLELAQSFFPKNGGEVVGIGVVSGAIVWGSSGLGAQALREIAVLRARLGEADTAVQIMEGIDEPVFSWNDMLSSEIPIETLNDLLDAASDVLSREEYVYVRVQHAQELILFGDTEEQRSWAHSTANAILQTKLLESDRAVSIYSTLNRIGAWLEDQDMQHLALKRMADAALRSRDFGDLIRAGFQWHQSDRKP